MKPIILIATRDTIRFAALADALERLIGADVHGASSGGDALESAGRLSPLLAVVDESLPDMTGLECVRKLIEKNALIHTALVSRLSPERFHETSEGLGVLVQLPVSPQQENAEDIVSGLKSVFALPS